jgi:hypothetical protein
VGAGCEPEELLVGVLDGLELNGLDPEENGLELLELFPNGEFAPF